MNKTDKPTYALSDIDNLFFDLFGYYPTKEGQSYELLVGAVLKILNQEKKIVWDERKKGSFDENNYQIDVSIYHLDTSAIMVEAKDHTKHGVKVKRPELDKIAGSLIELDFESGYFFSATDFTRDAKKKSRGSKINPNAKKIELYHLRPSDNKDLENRLETLKITISSYEIDPQKTSFNPGIPDAYYEQWKRSGLSTKLKSATEFYYDDKSIHCKGYLYDDHNNYVGEYEFLKSLEKSIYTEAKAAGFTIKGLWQVDWGLLTVNGTQINIDEIHYIVTFKEIDHDFEIKAIGNPALLVATEGDEINKLITDNQLKGISFNDNGEIEFNGAMP